MILDRLIFIVMFISLSSGTIWAKDDLLIQDVRARAAAGNGLHLSQGASSTLHNPANIVKTKSGIMDTRKTNLLILAKLKIVVITRLTMFV